MGDSAGHAALTEALAASPALIEQSADPVERMKLARENVSTGLQHLLQLALLTA